MRNKYGGNCYRCGLWVEPGTGHFERARGAWALGGGGAGVGAGAGAGVPRGGAASFSPDRIW